MNIVFLNISEVTNRQAGSTQQNEHIRQRGDPYQVP